MGFNSRRKGTMGNPDHGLESSLMGHEPQIRQLLEQDKRLLEDRFGSCFVLYNSFSHFISFVAIMFLFEKPL